MPPEDGTPPAGATDQPPAGDAGAGGQAPPADDQGGAPDGETEAQAIARLTRELAATRRESAGYRTRLQAAERERASASQEGLTELQKAQAQLADAKKANSELEARLQGQAIRQAAMEAATRLGFRSPDLAHRLIDREQLKFDDDGLPTNMDEQLKALLKDEPYLAKSGTGGDFGGGTRGGTPPSQPTMNDALRAIARGG